MSNQPDLILKDIRALKPLNPGNGTETDRSTISYHNRKRAQTLESRQRDWNKKNVILQISKSSCSNPWILETGL